jgi:hypothetical protein
VPRVVCWQLYLLTYKINNSVRIESSQHGLRKVLNISSTCLWVENCNYYYYFKDIFSCKWALGNAKFWDLLFYLLNTADPSLTYCKMTLLIRAIQT